jgi:hypothetical protein
MRLDRTGGFMTRAESGSGLSPALTARPDEGVSGTHRRGPSAANPAAVWHGATIGAVVALADVGMGWALLTFGTGYLRLDWPVVAVAAAAGILHIATRGWVRAFEEGPPTDAAGGGNAGRFLSAAALTLGSVMLAMAAGGLPFLIALLLALVHLFRGTALTSSADLDGVLLAIVRVGQVALGVSVYPYLPLAEIPVDWVLTAGLIALYAVVAGLARGTEPAHAGWLIPPAWAAGVLTGAVWTLIHAPAAVLPQAWTPAEALVFFADLVPWLLVALSAVLLGAFGLLALSHRDPESFAKYEAGAHGLSPLLLGAAVVGLASGLQPELRLGLAGFFVCPAILCVILAWRLRLGGPRRVGAGA